VFSGVGKTVDDITAALRAGILLFNVESPGELDAIDAAAGAMGVRARIALRVNPDVDPKTHPYISTGLKEEQVRHPYPALRGRLPACARHGTPGRGGCRLPHRLAADDGAPFVDALARVRDLVTRLHGEGFDIRYVDMGGDWASPTTTRSRPIPPPTPRP